MCTTGSTFAYWLKYKSPFYQAFVFDTGGYWSDSHGYTVMVFYDGSLVVSIADIANYYSTLSYNYDPDIWLFVVHTWSPSSGVIIYLNGCIMNDQDLDISRRTSSLTVSHPFTIGEAVTGNPQRADMDLDNFMAWDDQLTADEVWQLYVQAGYVPVS